MNPFEILAVHGPRFLHGLGMTLLITGLGAAIAALISPWFALWRAQGGIVAQSILRPYISMMRGTPLLAQLFLVYYGSGQFRPELQAIGLWGFFREPLNCAVFAFALNSTAYQTEILRGGILGVPRGEIEAARAIAMPRGTLLRRVVFPHAYRIAWPALGNEIILLMKASALASVVTVYDVMGVARQTYQKTFDFSALLWAAVIYLAVTGIFVTLWRLGERALSPHVLAMESMRRA
jgi:polar amino acid transport system permease protein